MKKRVTQKEIAEKAGVHVTTVSAVLRNKANFSADTRENVLRVARELGYRPDPMLNALAAYRSNMGGGGMEGNVLALVGLGPEQDLMSWGYERIRRGIDAAAGALGYRVEFFDLSAERMTGARLSQILYNRGILGVIVPPGPEAELRIDEGFDLDLFSVVAIEDFLASPHSLHRVMTDHVRNVRVAMETCVKAGCRQFGLISSTRWARRQHYPAYASMAGSLFRYGGEGTLEVLMQESWNAEEIVEWVLEHRPEVVFCNSHEVVEILRGDSRVGVPEKCGVVHFNILDEEEPYAGVRISLDSVGEQSVNLLVSMIHRGERGLPEHNIELSIPGSWHPGPTVSF